MTATSRQPKISLLVSDVDGTLVTKDKVLTPRAIAAVQRLDERGIGFTVTSSRPPRGLSMLVAPLNIRLPMGGFNGGGLVRPDLSPIDAHTLDPGAAREAVDLILGQGLDAWVYNAEDWFVRDAAAPHVAHEEFTIAFPPKVVTSFDAVLDRVGKIVAVGDDAAAVTRCNDALSERLGTRGSATKSQSFFIDITHPDANKGTLIATLSRLLAIPTAEIATIGDMDNDVLMFRESGLSIAMGNATPAVKSQAKRVTASNEEDGFAQAVERFLLDNDHDA